MQIIAIIPARSGSKGVPDKNIRPMAGKPLLAWSIEHAIECELISRVIVSTDSESYANIAQQYGAEVPFLRPEEISGDLANDQEVFSHALNWLKSNEPSLPDIVVHLWPTYPARPQGLITEVLNVFLPRPDADSIRTVSLATSTPYKMWRLNEQDDTLIPIIASALSEPYNLPRQVLPPIYKQNACVQAFRVESFFKNNSVSGKKILGFEMTNDFDIDTEDDWREVESYLRTSGSAAKPAPPSQLETRIRTFCFDIDGVIASLTPNNNYAVSSPIPTTVQLIQSLYNCGHRIILNTARGDKTGIDWKATTVAQLQSWGVPYHEIRFSKPAADFYVDDRMISLADAAKFTRT